ncbi:hypothetical protein BGX26_010222 [Mortierella sp. AD094]|nr:hypothetical protein BGX26_010222 [Mortierella sp. AD094]
MSSHLPGIGGLWPFLKKKGYEPVVRYHNADLDPADTQVLSDNSPTLRDNTAYSVNSSHSSSVNNPPSSSDNNNINPTDNFPKRRVDVLRPYVSLLRNAYLSHPPAEPHAIVEREMLLLGARKNWILYLDGFPSDEKRIAQSRQEEVRRKALALAQNGIKDLSYPMEKKQRVRKQQFITVDKEVLI